MKVWNGLAKDQHRAYYGRTTQMSRIPSIAGKFIVVLMAMTVVCSIVWEMCVNNTLYNCTDPGWLDFLFPGGWVHPSVGLVSVPHVIDGRSMSEPDQIKAGWSIAGLWWLWWGFVTVSLTVSACLARRPWPFVEDSRSTWESSGIRFE